MNLWSLMHLLCMMIICLAADDYAYELAISIVDEEFIVTITKEQALEVLDTYDLLPTDGYVSLPPYLDSYEYFERYSKIRYMDFTCPENFEEDQNSYSPLFPGITYEEAIDQLYGFVKKNRMHL